ncbi:hypothetical protein BAUCODRAFT_32422 [Baudoinia panamericana UAMH 10762]|uniref:Very-long-chain (3R)-3-hydroxyacyl-CoA dehydratase n=1 Tax=Baudoinia panamericana (strain UAMH 10762) TaxID=717646 RepID=M2LUU9_BAUPA|nr:uncharacterized protein BAUCODRAFT_32422 [Baudoinia panamericana UAMH 10762]EMC98387.1 hypothetical protein BAUCODRAFT_32422 [Baudoinia panamericana UAMH 10762]
MNRPGDSQRPPPQAQQAQKPADKSSMGLRSLYLIQYNFVSAVLWASILARVLLLNATEGYQDVYPALGETTKWIQTLAGLEVFHAAVGLVRAPVLTTVMQVASRFLLVWVIADRFPATVSGSPAYSTMLIAWSVTEVIRYSYFAIILAYEKVPASITWLRYNTFFVLYPLGIASECWLIWISQGPGVVQLGPLWRWFVYAVLAIYVPGAYILFTHMMAQRRKVMRTLNARRQR